MRKCFKGTKHSLVIFINLSLFLLQNALITYIALLYLQHDTILILLTLHYIIVIVISNAFAVLQTSLTIHKKKTYLQYLALLYLLTICNSLRLSCKKAYIAFWADFLHALFLENEVQINKNNYASRLFLSKQVSLPKISSILQKIKIGPKCYICSFCRKAFNYLL